jgi:hypothetical protein
MDEPRLKIGLLVGTEMVPLYTYRLAQWGQKQRNLVVSHVIIQKDNLAGRGSWFTRIANSIRRAGRSGTLRRGSFRLLHEFERFRLCKATGEDYFQQYDVTSVVEEAISLESRGPKTDASDRSFEEDLKRIKSLGLDAIIACDSTAELCREIRDCTKLGMISFADGDVEVNGIGALGFWEVYLQQDATEFAILHATGDSGDALLKGRFPTKHFYLLNRVSVYKRGIYYLTKLLEEIAVNGKLPPSVDPLSHSDTRSATPSVADQLIYLLRQLAAIVRKTGTRYLLKKRYRWGVSFAKSDWSTLVPSQSSKVEVPPDHFLADPFVAEESGRHFCFVEDYDYKIERACISAYALGEATAERLGEAIVEPFHMSFPYLFRFSGKWYMCPETSANRDIRLYECTEFPLRWKLCKIVMTDVVAADTMIFERDGRWWLFTNIDPVNVDGCSELSIFYSESPLADEWKAHKKNPIMIDSTRARNAGLLFRNGSIFRVAQRQGFDQYGKSITINKIEVLNTDDYAETAIRAVVPNFLPKIRGIHHLHSNNSVSVFDYDELAPIGK